MQTPPDLNQFMTTCMNDPELIELYPNPKQRKAICALNYRQTYMSCKMYGS